MQRLVLLSTHQATLLLVAGLVVPFQGRLFKEALMMEYCLNWTVEDHSYGFCKLHWELVAGTAFKPSQPILLTIST